jgi:hypothetical protein
VEADRVEDEIEMEILLWQEEVENKPGIGPCCYVAVNRSSVMCPSEAYLSSAVSYGNLVIDSAVR